MFASVLLTGCPGENAAAGELDSHRLGMVASFDPVVVFLVTDPKMSRLLPLSHQVVSNCCREGQLKPGLFQPAVC